MSNMRIAFIGAGNMASSLIGGLLAKGLDVSLIRASDPGAETRARVSAEHGIELFADNGQAVKDADVIVIAVKPQVMKAVCQDLRAHLKPHQLLISIAAGITCDSLQNWLGNQPLVRCMPNTPALLGKGVSGLFATAAVTGEQRQQAEDLLSAVGIAVWVDTEAQIDAVTAVSGSGPAYFFLLIEAMTDAGVKLGLPREVARQLAEQTALGAAYMAVSSDVDAGELRRRVTSPAGTTEAAIKSFQADGFATTVEKALSAAAHRSAEMAEQLGQ
ncbi:pyrroline-5-carboxylate reductase [Pseudomonas versuta]|uniref:Pyrroline-5-carboxylate reductase n=1 Tax=Pseudomonas versuta TaxID=1788301 RepID=A0ABX3EB51_9PSED|nr:pyrroline-5-carboxylate reductase [Pseudomonas versuta]ALE90636.1 pyrroline-5-carboxylate reductase [Pseudomonas versuta]OKA23334.1 pyrroline-5-carboxylate reductase [Pseudomonas versuta]